ncbi:MAG: hypothetical protein FWG64_12665 [Firmicutes bacterium]|nr:hypothetical protein [Bacillota bacterium]
MFGYEYSLEREMADREFFARKQGEEEQTLEIATNLIKFGMEPATIAKVIKRPLNWVENLIS